MADQSKRLENKKGDSRARAVSAVALVATILVIILVVVAAIVGVVYGIRVNNRLKVLEEQIAQSSQVSADLEEYKGEVDARFASLEGASGDSEPQFSISDLIMDSEITEYDYIDDYVTYEGEGSITETTGSSADYLVVLKQTLVSGGVSYAEPVTYMIISVVDGSGDFSTYDYGSVFEVDQPTYDFEIIGFITIND